MKYLAAIPAGLCALALLAGAAPAAEEVDATQLITDPDEYVRRTVTTTVRFNRVIPHFRGWEDQDGLRQNRYVKFAAQPLAEINCFAPRNPENEKAIGGLQRGQALTLTGYLKKSKMEVKVKVDGDGPARDRTHKRSVKGATAYVFIVKEIKNVGSPLGQRPSGRRGRGGRRF